MGDMKPLSRASSIAGTTNSYTFPSFDAPKETAVSSSNVESILLPFFGGLGALMVMIAIVSLFWYAICCIFSSDKKNEDADSAPEKNAESPELALDFQDIPQKSTVTPKPILTPNTNTPYKPIKVAETKISVITKKDNSDAPIRSTNKYEIFNIRPHSKAWNDLHKGRITGSSAIYLKYNPLDSAIRRSDFDNAYIVPNEAIRRALRLKPKGAAEFAKEYGHDVKSVSFIKSLTHRKAGFSPDGVILNDEGKIQSIVCVKAFGRERHLASAHGIEEKVMYQAQFGLFVTGATHAYVVFYNPDIYPAYKQMIVKKVGRDEVIIDLFKKRFDERSRSSSKTTSSTSSRYSNAYALLNSYGKA